MINVDIDPVIVSLGFFSLRWYSLLVMAAVVTGVVMAWREVVRQGITVDTLLTLSLWAIPGGIIGSRLVHVIDQLSFYLAHPGSIIGGEGQAIYGAILGGALAAWIGAKVHRQINFARFMDAAAPGIPLAHSVGRLANVVNGDAAGQPTSVPWAFIYTNPNTYAPLGVATHPSPVYEIIWLLVVFAVIYRLRGRLKPDEALFVAYLGLYSFGRFFINFSRVNDPFFFGLHQAQFLALVVFLAAGFWLAFKVRWAKKEPAAS